MCYHIALIQTINKDTQIWHHWPFCEQNPPVSGGFPSQSLSNTESDSTHNVGEEMHWYRPSLPVLIWPTSHSATDNMLQILPLQSRTLRPSTPADVHEDAINGSRAIEDANLATLSPPGLKGMANVFRRHFENRFLLFWISLRFESIPSLFVSS